MIQTSTITDCDVYATYPNFELFGWVSQTLFHAYLLIIGIMFHVDDLKTVGGV